MVRFRVGTLLALCAAVVLCGCQHFKGTSESQTRELSGDEAQRVRNNCASLLYDVLNDEKDLNKLLLIKKESDPLEALVKSIVACAADGVKKLEDLARADRTLQLRSMELPPGDAATREAMAKTKQHELLGAKETDFEVRLLLTQVEALNYGAHLAVVAARNEPNPGSSRVFFLLSQDLKALHQKVLTRLSEVL